MRARYYDPEIGRFIRRDTVQEINQYAYAADNPVMLVDPSGHSQIYVQREYGAAHLKYIDDNKPFVYLKIPGVSGLKFIGSTEKGYYGDMPYVANITNDFIRRLKVNAGFMQEHAFAYWTFKNKVQTGGDWDFKNNIYTNSYYIVGDKLLRNDDLGNIHYGFTGRAGWLSKTALYTLPGLVQIKQGTSSFSFWSSYFDDPRDQKMIEFGIDLYENFGLGISRYLF